MPWLKLLHVVSVGFFSGGLLAMLGVQSLLSRSLDDAERRTLARAVAGVGKLVVVLPLSSLAFVSGLLSWAVTFGFRGPPYLHVMLLAGLLAVGMSHAWLARARKLAAALDQGTPYSEAKAHLERGWVFAGLALAFLLIAYVVAVLKVPAGH
jgi:hypothetical protein